MTGHPSVQISSLDYKLWLVLEECACTQRHQNLNPLKTAIVKVAREIPLAMIRESIDDKSKRLWHGVQAKGGQFE